MSNDTTKPDKKQSSHAHTRTRESDQDSDSIDQNQLPASEASRNNERSEALGLESESLQESDSSLIDDFELDIDALRIVEVKKQRRSSRSEPTYPEWKALCLAFSEATGIYSAQVAPVVKALLVSYPDATGDELKRFYADWRINRASIDPPVKVDSLPRNFGQWRKKVGASKANNIPHELTTERPGMIQHPDYPVGSRIYLTQAQYRALMNDRKDINGHE